MPMRHGCGVTRSVKGAAAVVVAAALMSGCSSHDPAQAKELQRDYCTKLGSWQDAAHATPTSEADTESAGRAVVAASKRLDQAGLEHGGTHILDDTVDAVGGDIGAEGRAVSYCDSSGFETLVSWAG
ncbi:hypothetical protein [Streptomyces sp. NPDC051016]|uniref:hypothetical protein n=1 Tax=Streptomyces sp. NPDC051016 TaxID=3365638 RepID=UPI0037A3671D